MKNISLQLITLSLIILTITACQKENKWRTEVERNYDITAGEVTVDADYYLPRNNNYIYVGVCIADEADPTIASYLYKDKQELNSGVNTFYFEGLNPNTEYYSRSFIKTKNGDVIYSENKLFTTDMPAESPCEPSAGQIQFSGSTYEMDALSATEGEVYELFTDCALGELTFTFKNKPTPNVYTTINPSSEITDNTIQISCILGGVFSCYYGSSNGYDTFVTVSDDDKISIEFCDAKISSASCDNSYTLFGEVHQ